MILFFIFITVILITWFYKKTIPEIGREKKYLLIFLRSISIIAVLILLLNPILYFSQKISKKSEIFFLSDISESMNQKKDEINKIATLKEFKEKIKDKLVSQNYNISEIEFANGMNGIKSSTNLSKTFEDISKKLSLTDVKNIFLFSDGWFRDENLNILDDFNIPIFTFNPNFEITDFDLEISNLNFNKNAYKNEITPIIVNVSASHFNQKAKVNLIINGKTSQTKNVDFSNDNFQQIIFEQIFEKTGLQPFEIVIESDMENEINLANNRFPAAIQVLDNRAKILVISDNLNWDVKFILDAVEKNQRWNSDFLLKDRILKKGRKTTSLSENIKETVVLILINYDFLNLTHIETEIINNFVKNGGGLLIFGKPVTSLIDILPAIHSGIASSFKSTFYFTDESKKFQTFEYLKNTDEIPPVDYYYVNAKLQAEILAKIENDEQSPAILFNEFENGKVLYFSFNNLWKWQLRNSDYSDFMTNIILWLSASNTERFVSFTDKYSYFEGEKIMITLTAFDEKLAPITNLTAKLIIKQNEKKILEEYLLEKRDEYFAEIEELEKGSYRYSIFAEKTEQQTSGNFLITDDNPEARDRGFNQPLLAYISKQTNGKIIDEETLSDFTFPKAISKIEELKTELPIYRKWYLIAIFLVCFCTELFLRKRWGLL
ncbi:MAG: hypothetical protein HQ534_10340 [Armatimonadetes bacterium]|nr:hypothetical protein [Armatimonadota bacterium]